MWVRTSTRWAIYLRDNLACVYCGVTMAEILSDYDTNFLTLDHVLPLAPLKGGRKGDNSPGNLVCACYDCNVLKGRGTVRAMADRLGQNPNTLKDRVRRRRLAPLDPYREAARVLLGALPGVPIADMVVDHDWLVKRQWSETDPEGEYWAYVRDEAQERLFCPSCRKPREADDEARRRADVRAHWTRPTSTGAAYGTVWDDEEIPF